MKRSLSLLLCLVMLLSLIPAAAAEDIVIVSTEEPGEAGLIEIVDPGERTPPETEPGTEILATTGKPVITASPESVTAYVGTTAKFTVTATGAESYQWYFRTSAEGSWKESTAASAATATLSVKAETFRSGYQYYCKVRNANGTSYTKAATLTVTEKPLIKTQPASVTAQAGTEAKFTVKATGAESYQWYYRTSASGSWNKSTAASAATATLTVTAEKKRDGYQYRCKVSNAKGSVYSEAATLTVEAIPKPEITKQPQDFTASTGTEAYFRVTATGAERYQWYYRTSASGSWVKSTAATAGTDTLTVTAEAKRNGYQYRCKVSNAGGSVYSEAATLKTAGAVTYRALLIGEVSFTWETANRNKGDVLRMQRLLEDIQGGFGGSFAVTSCYDLSNSGVRDAIRSTFAGADDNDVSLFFIASHGVVDIASGPEAGEIVTIGANDDEMLTLGQLAAWLKEVPGKVVVLLGSCGSGAAIVSNGGEVSFVPNDSDEYDALFTEAVIAAFEEQNEMIPVSDDGVISNTGEFRSSKFYVLTAAAHEESSWGFEGGSLEQSYNAFAYYFVEGASGVYPADTDRSGTLTMKEMYKFLQEYATGPYNKYYYQHVQMYPANSTYGLLRYNAAAPEVISQPLSYIANKDMTVTFKVVAKGADSYQWEYRKSEIDSWKKCSLSGNKTASIKVTVTDARSGYEYRCRVSGPGGEGFSDYAVLYCTDAELKGMKWMFDSDGCLTILGTGALPGESSLPWNDFRSEIRSVVIGSGVTSISSKAFASCSNLTSVSIPETVTKIGSSAFKGCENLTDITIPKAVTKINGSTFYGCNALKKLTIPDGVTSIGSYAFCGCHALENLKIPAGVTSIGDHAFHGCWKLTELAIPEAVTSIGSYAFYGCSALKSMVIPEGITSIGDYTFYACRKMVSVEIPDSVTSIGESAFGGCDYLAEVKIPQGVSTISNNCFVGCQRMKKVTIPEGVTSIGNSAFLDCRKLTGIVIPDSVAIIGNNCFSNCSALKSITLGSGLTTIGANAFYNCKSLETLAFPDSVVSIGEKCIVGCDSLKSLSIGKGLTSIGEGYLANDALETITVASGNASYTSSGGALLNKKKTTLIFCPQGMTGTFTIPSTVKTIGEMAFGGCRKLTGVIIPSSVTTIGKWAFLDCTGLLSMTIPGTVKTIKEEAFSGCSQMTSLTIEEGVETIGTNVFYCCHGLKTVTVPQSVTKLGNAFNCCYFLEDAVILANITALPRGIFANCALKSVTLSATITKIEDYAFTGCHDLTDVYFKGTKAQWEKVEIGDVNGSILTATVHYNA